MDNSEIHITKNAEETQKLGETVAACLMEKGSVSALPHIVCLYGNLGMGKTTFVQGFARGLGITSRLLSPTFIIVRRHRLKAVDRFLYHLDLYRINTQQSIEDVGVQEIFDDSRNIVLIEWAERLGSLLPKKRVDIRFSCGKADQERRIEITYV